MDKSCNIILIALSVMLLRKDSYNAIEVSSTIHIFLSMINWSYCRSRKRLTISITTRRISLRLEHSLICTLNHRRRPSYGPQPCTRPVFYRLFFCVVWGLWIAAIFVMERNDNDSLSLRFRVISSFWSRCWRVLRQLCIDMGLMTHIHVYLRYSIPQVSNAINFL